MRPGILLRLASGGWPPEGGLRGVASWGWPPEGGLRRLVRRCRWCRDPAADGANLVHSPLLVHCCRRCWDPAVEEPTTYTLLLPVRCCMRCCCWGANLVHPPPSGQLLQAMLLLRSQPRTLSSFWSAVAFFWIITFGSALVGGFLSTDQRSHFWWISSQVFWRISCQLFPRFLIIRGEIPATRKYLVLLIVRFSIYSKAFSISRKTLPCWSTRNLAQTNGVGNFYFPPPPIIWPLPPPFLLSHTPFLLRGKKERGGRDLYIVCFQISKTNKNSPKQTISFLFFALKHFSNLL